MTFVTSFKEKTFKTTELNIFDKFQDKLLTKLVINIETFSLNIHQCMRIISEKKKKNRIRAIVATFPSEVMH